MSNLRPITEPRVITASFSDWRTVKGRKCLQLVFEVPLESQAEVLTMLGAPLPDDPRWCAIAVLNSPASHHPTTSRKEDAQVGNPIMSDVPKHPPPNRPARETQRERYHNATDGQRAVMRAGMLAQDRRFQDWACFLAADEVGAPAGEKMAARYIRDHCGVLSRRQIETDPEALRRFLALETEYLQSTGQMAEGR